MTLNIIHKTKKARTPSPCLHLRDRQAPATKHMTKSRAISGALLSVPFRDNKIGGF